MALLGPRHTPALALALAACLPACAAGPEVQGNPSPDGGGFVTIPDGGAITSCRGNRNGTIARNEVVFVPGVEVRYRINPPNTLANVAPRGVSNPDGTRTWDFADRTGEPVTLSLSTSAGQWWQSRFPTAQYASRLDPRSPNLGVYRAGDDSVELLGLVAPAESTMTVVPYEPGVPVLRFPLSMGTTWTADSTTRDAQVEGTPVASRDRYTFVVDARGTVRLPELTFTDALRLRIELTQMFAAGPGVRKIQYLWLVECYGEVARMTSRDGEVDPDFTSAVEFRRLGL
ncbi:MAG: hypothetical protein Q8S73_29335 [Deltaproteobacteria bacterium]|nr:hypothetical protein [Myxococcales bacterium]MDP3218246.1 hypothetical protein [Deltaproteobacteria bacterium]